ncbi:MAG: orotidine-5'-phosphate decarboxylase [Salana multivorans]|uniref:orotidine-5'-phosphate decarboxylase n=1 Tax=Salana multivorans TaxID=120377 RepID=UPI0009694F8A|nr:orotidine-5'-phosphate decarboxylase [Salana multivorans]MBN8881794.1 orotidine-5'-phosphate decarboxylase [Salana multivorans]OJX94355.1 MAG: orotidine 5'-phosphate decarboxylase [Micrococcales bacterium 73-15]
MSAGARPFGERLAGAIDATGRLCVGIDPHPQLLTAWGLADDATGLREFSLRVVEALAGSVAALKPQAAFYERHGSAGIAVLEETIAAARAAGVLTIVDAKRGDIGSTMQGYADAFLREGSPLAGDAVTLSPYLGFGSLAPAIDTALAAGRGVFVLCLTSNPEGASVQLARSDTDEGRSVAATIARAAAALNAEELAAGGDPGASRSLGSVGLVVGATIGEAARAAGVDLVGVRGPLLMPGVGAQGGSAQSVRAVVGEAWQQVLASSSREVLGAGPSADDLRSAAARAAASLA